jgi:hypothetical protein
VSADDGSSEYEPGLEEFQLLDYVPLLPWNNGFHFERYKLHVRHWGPQPLPKNLELKF